MHAVYRFLTLERKSQMSDFSFLNLLAGFAEVASLARLFR